MYNKPATLLNTCIKQLDFLYKRKIYLRIQLDSIFLNIIIIIYIIYITS